MAEEAEIEELRSRPVSSGGEQCLRSQRQLCLSFSRNSHNKMERILELPGRAPEPSERTLALQPQICKSVLSARTAWKNLVRGGA